MVDKSGRTIVRCQECTNVLGAAEGIKAARLLAVRNDWEVIDRLPTRSWPFRAPYEFRCPVCRAVRLLEKT